MTLGEFLIEWHNDSPYVKVQTSGSTGTPKPMFVEKRRMLASARRTNDFLGLQKGDTALLCMSLDYIAGKMMVVRAIERDLELISVEPSGHPLAMIQGDGSFVTSASDVTKEPSPCYTFAAMVPMQVYNSLRIPEERERLKQIKHLIIGGGAIDERLAEELREFPNNVWSTYGMTETLSHIALRRLSGPEASEWYTPFPSVEVGINDEGCLVIDAPEVCAERLVTNDIAVIQKGSSPSVAFRILGRKDNVICSGGMKIQIEEVERLLRSHIRVPYLISKRPDKKFGEVVVLLTKGDVVDAQMVCEAVLPKYQRPKAYVHVSEIPLTETGKPARRQAEELAKFHLPHQPIQ